MTPENDSDLLRQFAENQSDAAFAGLVERHINLVYSVAHRQTGDEHLAEEITQAVFITLSKKAGTLRHEQALSSWLFQTTRLTANNFLRSELRRRAREQEAYMQSTLNESAENVWPRIAPLLDSAVETLGETDRRAILLRFYEGRNLREVGTALGATEDAAKKRVNRAVEKLRKFFTKRGVVLTTTALTAAISANSVQAAPVGMAAKISTAVVASAVTTTVKSAVVAKSAGTLQTIGFAASALGAAVGGIVAIWGHIQNAHSIRERDFLMRAWLGFPVWAVFWLVSTSAVAAMQGGVITFNDFYGATLWSSVWLVQLGIWVAYIIWMRRIQKRIQIEDGTYTESVDYRFAQGRTGEKGFKAVVYGNLAVMIFGPGGWIPLAIIAAKHEHAFAVGNCLAVAAWLIGAQIFLRCACRIKTMFAVVWWGLMLTTLVSLNVRWGVLVNHPEKLWPDDPQAFHSAPAFLNFLIVVFYGSIGLAWWVENKFSGHTKDFSATQINQAEA